MTRRNELDDYKSLSHVGQGIGRTKAGSHAVELRLELRNTQRLILPARTPVENQKTS
jgi:hypothetical protein